MCRLSDAELYCVRTNVRRTSELMQFESAISTSRYLPPRGTAGFDRCCVSGKRRLPAPPPRMTANSLEFAGISDHHPSKRRIQQRKGLYPRLLVRSLHQHWRRSAWRLDSKLRSNSTSHESDVGNSSAAFRETGRGLHKISAGFLCCVARTHL